MTLPEGTDNIHGESLIAPACEICGCTVDEESRRYYVDWGGAPEDSWPGSHTDCVEYEMYLEIVGKNDQLESTIRGKV